MFNHSNKLTVDFRTKSNRSRLERFAGVVCLASSYSLTGCGFQVPAIEPLASSQLEVGRIVTDIADHIGCEIGIAVSAIHQRYHSNGFGREIEWLDTWAAKITLKIVVQEKTVLAPGISLKTIFPNATTTFGTQIITSAQTFSFGLGGQFSGEATRTEILGYFVSLGALRKRVEAGRALSKDCPTGVGPNIEGDLKFREWLEASILPAMNPGTMWLTEASLEGPSAIGRGVPEVKGEAPTAVAATVSGDKTPKAPPFDVISHEVNFVILVSGNVTPTWTLVTFSANTGNTPLLGATRTRTNNVLVTMGPAVKDPSGNFVPSQSVQFQHLSSQINRALPVFP